MSRKSFFAVVLIGSIAIGFGYSGAISHAQNTGAKREVLVTGKPAAARGKLLQLQRVTIPAHVTLPVHVHPGMQAAWIASGTLHYSIVHGQAQITRAPGDGTPRPTETFTDGSETDLHPGDALVETEGLIHFAENRTDEPVDIFVASLLTEGMPGTQEVNMMATPVG